MIRSTVYTGSLLAFSLLFSPNAARALCTFPFTDLVYGLWQSDDGGKYHMRQIGGDVWWVGISAEDGKTFMNVFHGQIHGDQLTGGWLDVPHDMEKRTNAGQVTIKINDPHRPTVLTKLPSPTGPAASKWTRIFSCDDTR